jgi:hypothetical protein
MMRDAIAFPVDGFVGRRDSELVGELHEEYRGAIKQHLVPGEYVVWAGRGNARPLPSIPFFPAFFAMALCAMSGIALMVLFGIYAIRGLDPREKLFLLCLAPGALGCASALGLACGWARHRIEQRRISKSFYVLTDRRAIAGMVGHDAGDVTMVAWAPGMFDGTLCIEHGPGGGDVYFTRDGEVVEPRWGFEGIEQATRVDALIREVLLGEKVLSGADLGEL